MNEESSLKINASVSEAVFQQLNHSTRLSLLECLADHDEPLSLTDAAEEIASGVEPKPGQDNEAENVKQLHRALYHWHIPQLEAHNIVHHNEEHDLVGLTERGHKIAADLNKNRR